MGRKRDEEFEEEPPEWEAPGGPEEDDSSGEAEVECPYCGEVNEISLDAAGGATQDYVEDCQVCCRPWQVHVVYGLRGAVEVRVEQAG